MTIRSPHRQLRVLVVEDRAADAELLVRALRRDGIELEWQRVETEAEFRSAIETDPDLIFADYTLPTFSAPAALRILHDIGREIPFVVVTGTATHERIVACVEQGAYDYLLKSRLERVGVAVTQAMERAQLRRANRTAKAALERRARQRAAVAELGQRGLAGSDVRTLMEHAVATVVEQLAVDHCVLLEHLPEERRLVLRAVAGALDVTPDKTTIRIERGSYAGFVLAADGPVRVPDLAAETRFDPPAPLLQAGVVSSISVPIPGSHGTFGVLGAHTCQQRALTSEDAQFLQSVGNLISLAIERSRQEAELVEARDRAQEASRMKSAFLSAMSHELRTPLTGILGAADLLVDDVPEPSQPLVDLVQDSGNRLLETLDSVLELAQLESGEHVLRPEPIDLAHVVHEVAESYRAMAAEKALDFELALPDEPVAAHLDARAVSDISRRLIANAVKFTPAGRVSIGLRAQDGWAELRVSDTGVGIADETRARLFDPFEQESTGYGRRFEGSGLGLAIAQRLVGEMDGAIRLDSRKDEGTTVTVRLPLHAGHEANDDGPPVLTNTAASDTDPSSPGQRQLSARAGARAQTSHIGADDE